MNWWVALGIAVALWWLSPESPEVETRRGQALNLTIMVVFCVVPALLIGHGVA